MSSQWTGSIEWLEGLKNGIQYRGGFLSMYGFQQPVTGYLIGLLMLATWLNEQAVTAYQLIKSESKEFTSEVVYKLAAVSLKVCLRVLTMVCSLKPSTATLHTSSGKFTHHWGKPEQNVLFFQFWKWLLKHTNLPLRINEVFLILILINTKKKMYQV